MNANFLGLRVLLFSQFRHSDLNTDSFGGDSRIPLHGRAINWGDAGYICQDLQTKGTGFLVGAVEGSTERVDLGPRSPLDVSLSELPFSVRARNCFKKAGIETVGDLASVPADKLLRMKNLGRKTFNEILSALFSLGLEPGSDAEKLAGIRGSALSRSFILRQVDIRCLISVDHLGCGKLSRFLFPAVHLYQLNNPLQPELGASIPPDELQRFRAALQLIIGHRPLERGDWTNEELSELASIFKQEAETYAQHYFQAFDTELLRRLSGLSSRNQQIANRYLGFDGGGGTTLEEAGQQFGLTRERIRQVAVKAVELITAEPVPATLKSALNFVESRCPASAESIERELPNHQFSSKPFELTALKTVGELFGLSPNFFVRTMNSCRFALRASDEDNIEHVLRTARRRISHFGITSVPHIKKALCDDGMDLPEETVRNVLDLLESNIWLDSERIWFWAPAVPRNPVRSRAKKAVWVAERISILELREAVLRDSRMAEVDLPHAVFSTWCRSVPEFLVSPEEIVASRDKGDHVPAFSDMESAFIAVLSDRDTPIRKAELSKACSRVTQFSLPGFDRMLSSSPVVKPLGEGLYTLTGSSIQLLSPSSGLQTQPRLETLCTEIIEDDVPEQLLADLDPTNELFCLNAAQRILSRARSLGFLEPNVRWSLIELNWSSVDLDVLRLWSKTGPLPGRSRGISSNGSMTNSQAIALVFLAYCADVGRHFSAEGELWYTAWEHLGVHLQQSFFSARFVPKQWLHESTEDVCRQLRLRNVFGKEGTLSWIRTVGLQFGLAFASLTKLPNLLSGGKLPVAITDLLEDSQLSSATFRTGWLILDKFRHELLDFEDAASQLAENPWFSEFGEQVVEATERPYREDDPANDSPLEQLFDIRVHWDNFDPELEIVLGANWPTELQKQEYVIRLGDQLRTTVHSQGTHSYRPRIPLRVPLKSNVAVISVLDGERVIEEISIPVLHTDDEILAFDRHTGKKLDIWEVHPSRPVILASKSDLQVSPIALRSRRVAGGTWTLHDFSNGCSPECCVRIGEEILWQVSSAPLYKAPETPRALIAVPGGRFGEVVPVRIHVPSGTHVTGLVINGQTVRTTNGEFRLELRPVNYEKMRASIVIQNGNQIRKIPARISLESEVWGVALRMAKDSWLPLRLDDELDAETLSGRKIVAVPPSRWKGHSVPTADWAIMEGSNFCARPRKSPIADFRPSLGGLGESLRLIIGPYNSLDGGVCVVNSVLDKGVISDVRLEEGRWKIQLRNGMDVGPLHELWQWSPGHPVPFPVDFKHANDELTTDSSPEVLGFALSYKGECIGRSFAGKTSLNRFADDLSIENWIVTSKWIRWWRIPVFASPIKERVLECVKAYRFDTFRSWAIDKSNDGLPYSEESAGSVGWSSVIREFFWDWVPSNEDAANMLVLSGLLTGNPERDIAEGWSGARKYLSLHPVLLVLLARCGIRELYRGISDAEIRMLLGILANKIVGTHRNGALPAGAAEALLQEAAHQTGIDSTFIKRGLWAETQYLLNGDSKSTNNLKVALNVQPIRRWLALELLQTQRINS